MHGNKMSISLQQIAASAYLASARRSKTLLEHESGEKWEHLCRKDRKEINRQTALFQSIFFRALQIFAVWITQNG